MMFVFQSERNGWLPFAGPSGSLFRYGFVERGKWRNKAASACSANTCLISVSRIARCLRKARS